MVSRLIRAWTDYPIAALGDAACDDAPVRPCRVLAYDGNKYLKIEVGGMCEYVKSGYVYTRAGRILHDWSHVGEPSFRNFRLSDGGLMRDQPYLTPKQLRALPRCP